MDGRDRGFIKSPQSLQQTIPIPGGFAAVEAARRESIEHRVGPSARRSAGSQSCFEKLAGFAQALADTLTQFGGGGLGKSNHEKLTHIETAFDNEAQVEGRDGEGFSRSRAGFDQLGAFELHGKCVEGLHQRTSSRWLSSGP